ncbi:MAG: DUF2142 domain-containing protein [Gemmiger sp.]|uniref:DUF2142 domain-containing protein n=1 Tax=Gemmiger sp. TaxID=2049027 RepID=UPI002E76CE5B|nr:DUF2142 domain-containing protein [Gemmiger sp.]MEE0801066.1 DUF2142 domain-containing protein [Gemmiger sp.]
MSASTLKKIRALLPVPAAALLGVLWAYYWRVFFYLDTRIAPLTVTVCCVAFAELCLLAAWLIRRFVPGFARRGAVCILACGLVFAFANPPLQTPDEADHYLRTYAISQGHFDFDAARTYPDDVAALLRAFPGAWVNANTSAGVGTDPDTGAEKPYNTAGYALKQYGSDGAILSPADSFARYFSGAEAGGDPVTEPVSFLIVPFLPGALGMALARLLGGGALACLYGGRIVNLLAYTLLCALALHKADKMRPVFLCIMLLPISLFLGASLSYDATLLGCYYLMLALLTREQWDTPTAALYAAACIYVNIAKPYLNLLWIVPVALVTARQWRARGRRWQWMLGMAAGALAVTMLVEWYGTVFRFHYPVIERQGGSTVNGGQQLAFVLSNPLRTLAVFWGTLTENDFFVGQLGLFGWKDMPISFLNLTGPLLLAAAALLAAAPEPGPGRRRMGGMTLFALVYLAGAMAAMYITYTPVGMVRIVGLQTRYFLPVWLTLTLAAAVLLRRTVRPALSPQRAAAVAVPLFSGYALLGAVLLFQHYYVGPIYTIPA